MSIRGSIRNSTALSFPAAALGGLVVGVALSLVVVGPVAHAQSFEDALAAAYQANPKLKAQQARARATDELVPQALSTWRPSLNLTGDMGTKLIRDNQDSVSSNGERLSPNNIGLTLTQPIFSGFRTVASTESAEERVRAERARLHDVEQTVLLDAASAYLKVARDQQIVKLNINHVRVLEKQLESAQDGFRIGNNTRTDVSQAEARLARAHADRTKAEADLAASVAAYQNVVGAMPGQLVLPNDAPRLPPDRATAENLAAAHNPLVVAAHHDRGSARENVRVAGSELLPSVSLNASSSRAYEPSAQNQRTTETQIRAVVEIPIYTGGVSQARVRQAKQNQAEQTLRMDVARRNAIESASKSWEAVLSARERLRAQETQIKAASLALEGVRREITIGARTLIDALNAEQELLDARTEVVRTRVDHIIAAFQLLQATGQLGADDLGLKVERYRPEDHYNEVRNAWFSTSASGEDDAKSEPAALAKAPTPTADKAEVPLAEPPPPQAAPMTPVAAAKTADIPPAATWKSEVSTKNGAAPAAKKDVTAAPASAKPPTPAKTAKPPGAATSAASAPRVQLAAERTDAQARETWNTLLKSHADLLDGLSPEILPLDLGGGKGTYHRLRVAPPATVTPRDFCKAMKARKLACFVVDPG